MFKTVIYIFFRIDRDIHAVRADRDIHAVRADRDI